jgi:imidazoleglycerol phosphate synthase glutamine amidotransferase subunit HisH
MYVLPLEIPLSRGGGWDQINWLNPATFCAYPKPETEIYFIFSFMLHCGKATYKKIYSFCVTNQG